MARWFLLAGAVAILGIDICLLATGASNTFGGVTVAAAASATGRRGNSET
jgi:hypothetical protein